MPTAKRWLIYVNAHVRNRAYGGAEEGGWWYDYGQALASMPIQLDTPIEREYFDGPFDEESEEGYEDRHVGWDDLSVNDAHTVALIVIELEKALDGYDDKRHEIGSVICDGKLEITLSFEQAHDWPVQRPHYE